jgi:hypothetical protein
MINPKHVHVSSEERYMYSPLLLEYLHNVTPPPPAEMPPPAKMPPTMKSTTDEFDFNKVQEKEITKDEEWITKERKERDKRNDAREGQGQDSPKIRNRHQHQPKITHHLNQMMKKTRKKKLMRKGR